VDVAIGPGPGPPDIPRRPCVLQAPVPGARPKKRKKTRSHVTAFYIGGAWRLRALRPQAASILTPEWPVPPANFLFPRLNRRPRPPPRPSDPKGFQSAACMGFRTGIFRNRIRCSALRVTFPLPIRTKVSLPQDPSMELLEPALPFTMRLRAQNLNGFSHHGTRARRAASLCSLIMSCPLREPACPGSRAGSKSPPASDIALPSPGALPAGTPALSGSIARISYGWLVGGAGIEVADGRGKIPRPRTLH